MRLRSASVLLAVALLVLVLSPSVAVAQPLMKQILRKITISEPIPDTDYRIDGWMSATITYILTPQGIRMHTSIVMHGKLFDTVAGEYVGKLTESGVSAALAPLEPVPPEDMKTIWTAILNIPGKDMQGIEGRMKTVFVMQNGDIKVNIYFEWLDL